MRVLVCHNRYRDAGGEDLVCHSETVALRAAGADVLTLEVHNASLGSDPLARLAFSPLWNRWAYSEVARLIRAHSIGVIHCHNIFPLLSPSIYFAAGDCGVPVVQTLHNFRLVCPGGTLFRDGVVCEDCVGNRVAWRAVAHRCYRKSVVATTASAVSTGIHWFLRTWERRVSRYIALTPFCREVMVNGGLPAEKIVVKPNCLATDPGFSPGGGTGALFVGRLTEEKGIRDVIAFSKRYNVSQGVTVIGHGPLVAEVEQAAESGLLTYFGQVPQAEVLGHMRRAGFLVLPSQWYEGLPMVLLQAFAVGLPVIAAGTANMRSLVEDGKTGLLYEPGRLEALAAAVSKLKEKGIGEELRNNARDLFISKYRAECSTLELLKIYKGVGA